MNLPYNPIQFGPDLELEITLGTILLKTDSLGKPSIVGMYNCTIEAAKPIDYPNVEWTELSTHIQSGKAYPLPRESLINQGVSR